MNLRERRVFVTGGGGFLGSHVVACLAAAGARVRTLLGPPGAQVVPAPAGVVADRAHIDDPAAIAALVAGSDVVVHAAGPPSVAASFDRPFEFARAHMLGTMAVLEACRSHGVGHLVHVSSAEVYGRPDRQPVSEDAPLRARSPYAAAKAGAEQAILAWAERYGLHATVLRPFSVYGPGAAPHGVVPQLLRQARAGGPLRVENPLPVRDFVHIDDVVAAVLRAAAHEGRGVHVYNVGTGVGTSIADLAVLVAGLAGLQDAVGHGTSPRSAADILELVADPGRIERDLGWRPAMPLAQGLRQTWQSMQEGQPWTSAS